MQYSIESLAIFVGGGILYAILSNAWRTYAERNVEILTIYETNEKSNHNIMFMFGLVFL